MVSKDHYLNMQMRKLLEKTLITDRDRLRFRIVKKIATKTHYQNAIETMLGVKILRNRDKDK